MNVKEYKKMYQKMEMTDQMNRKILKGIYESDRKEKKVVKGVCSRGAIAVAALIVVFAFGAMNADAVSAAIDKVVHYFSYAFVVTNAEGKIEKVDMSEHYIKLLDSAPKDSKRFNSMHEAGTAIGVSLLESKDYYSYDGCVTYNPVIGSDGQLNGAMLNDDLYYVGDLKEIKLNKSSDVDELDSMEYKSGKNYVTPIMAQISVRSDKDLDNAYHNRELGFVSEQRDVDLTKDSEDTFNAELFNMDRLGIKVVLFDVLTDGPVSWGVTDQIKVTYAVFVYNGIEYVYSGGLDHDTMKAFINTLFT